jgi:hypothetical protein
MHWAPTPVNPLVALRTAVCADRWQECWAASSARLREQAHERTRARRAERHHQRPAVLAEAASTAVPDSIVAVPAEVLVTPTTPTAPEVVDLAPSPATPAPARPTTRLPRRPAANHPWRRPALGPHPAAALAS